MNDVSQLQYMLERASAYGYKSAGFILDRGYFDENDRYFHIYYSDYRKASERSKLQQRIEQHRHVLESAIASKTAVKIDNKYSEFFDLIY